MNTTKQEVLDLLYQLTNEFDFNNYLLFSAKSMALELAISRSVASHYLNDLVNENLAIKIKSRPVFFLHKNVLEKKFHLTISESELMNIYELETMISISRKESNEVSKIIGYYGSLRNCIDQILACIKYPPNGLQIILHGEQGTGKRYIINFLYKYAKENAVVPAESRLLLAEAGVNDIHNDFNKKVFGYVENNEVVPGALSSSQYSMICIFKAESLTTHQKNLFRHLIEQGYYQLDNTEEKLRCKSRLIFITTIDPEICFKDDLIFVIPCICRVPNLESRYQEEKEELIYHILQGEAHKFDKEIYIDRKNINALQNSRYEQNINGLKKAVKLMCLNANADSPSSEKILYIYLYHLPDFIVKNYDGYSDYSNSEQKFIKVNNYNRNSSKSVILEFYDEIFGAMSSVTKEAKSNIKINEKINDCYSAVKKCYNYLLFDKSFDSTKLRIVEKSINEIINNLLNAKKFSFPVNCSVIIARMIYFNKDNTSLVENWKRNHHAALEEQMALLRNANQIEYSIIQQIKSKIQENLGFELDIMNLLILFIYLIKFDKEINERKFLSIIISHGYSTATSIADAVNTLLDEVIFDAIDMPLDTGVADIVEKIESYIEKSALRRDVLVLVDMGSLEDIGNRLNKKYMLNIGVINNVSTRLALEVGSLIRDGHTLSDILSTASGNTKCTYELIESIKQEEVIAFTSENGNMMSTRLLNLFRDSLPKNLNIELMTFGYQQLAGLGSETRVINGKKVLFVIGTSNPGVSPEFFVTIEDIINMEGIGIIYNSFSDYMSKTEINQFTQNIIRNFSLQNVVKHLVILEPSVLLDYVSESVDILQLKMNRTFTGKTMVGIYIHVCCLIERIITKNVVESCPGAEDFVNNKEFIDEVNESFSKVKKHYGIEIPMSEIYYLFEYIKNDERISSSKNKLEGTK